MPSVDTIIKILVALAAMGVGAWISELIRSAFGFRTVKKQSDTSLILAERQIEAATNTELRATANKLMQEWQLVVVDCKEREAQLGIQKYINDDLRSKLAESQAREKAKDDLIHKLKKRLNDPDDFDDYE
jgi:hypothetical protein